MSDILPQFVYMACRPGAESALKLEVARTDPDWRPAFSRPGFLTFKLPDGPPLDELKLAERSWPLAHAHGISLGKVTGDAMATLARQTWELAGERAFRDVHVWQREAGSHDAADTPAVATPLATEIEAAIRAAAPPAQEKLRQRSGSKRRPAARKARVLDVVIVEPNAWWVGFHRAVTPPARWPGGAIPIRLPPHAVSRAYAKMEEALAWSGLPLAADDECIELGCSPGGASQALLDRGLFVTGIDPAEVDPALVEHPRFRHLRKRSKEVRRSEFVGVRWLVADMNLAPNYTLDAVEAVLSSPDVSIRGMILTLKLADWELAEHLAGFAARVRGWGYRDVRLRQLTTGGQEVCLVALRRKELRRLSRKSKVRRGGRNRDGTTGQGPSGRSQSRRDPPHATLSGPHF